MFRFPFFPQGILATVQNDDGRQDVIQCIDEESESVAVVRETVRRHPERQRRIYYRGEERDSNGKNRDWVSLLVYKEVAGEAGRRILAWGNDAKE